MDNLTTERALLQALADTTVYFHHGYHQGDLMHCKLARCKANWELLLEAAPSPPIESGIYAWGLYPGGVSGWTMKTDAVR